MDSRQRLKDLLAEKALLRGDFSLSSGKKSQIYFDCKRVTLDPEGITLIGTLLLEEIHAIGGVDAVGGPSIGADPVVGHIAGRSHQEGSPLPGFIVRKNPKQHGTGLKIENCPPKGARVVIFEDVVTTGGSTLQAVGQAEAAGLKVVGIVSLLDREEGGADALKDYRYRPLFRRSDITA